MKDLLVQNKIMIKSSDRRGVYGPGVDRLLRLIAQTGSMNQACKKMNMSYSKAWKLINKTEEMLGFPLIERHSGAKGSDLTRAGKEMLNYYQDLVDEVDQAVKRVNKKY